MAALLRSAPETESAYTMGKAGAVALKGGHETRPRDTDGHIKRLRSSRDPNLTASKVLEGQVKPLARIYRFLYFPILRTPHEITAGQILIRQSPPCHRPCITHQFKPDKVPQTQSIVESPGISTGPQASMRQKAQSCPSSTQSPRHGGVTAQNEPHKPAKQACQPFSSLIRLRRTCPAPCGAITPRPRRTPSTLSCQGHNACTLSSHPSAWRGFLSFPITLS
jgi:hypothetical protein